MSKVTTLDVNRYAAVKVGLASPEKIREWSYGEVTKAETINYRSQKPELDGLFCERIFGPSKDYECHCGKYKKIRFQGMVCEKCGVEITSKSVRRERIGHIELATPVAHIWYIKGISPKMGLILDIPSKQVEEVIYFMSQVVLDAGNTKHLSKGDVLDEKTARERFSVIIKEIIDTLDTDSYEYTYGLSLIERMSNPKEPFEFSNNASFISQYTGAKFGVGAEAIQKLLQELDVNSEFEKIKAELKDTQGNKNQRRVKLLKRLEVINAFRQSDNKPEWMILTALPVLPPDLRPLLQLDGGRLAASDLNDLYRRVISRNLRLKKLQDMNAPTVILNNEKRMLQEAVDALIDNGRKQKPVTGAGGRALKSLSHSLKGKQGRFRQHLLGKRVDYSGRSVIAVGPDLKMYQCGLPKEMAVQLFRPFIAGELIQRGIVDSHKKADKLIDRMDDKIWDVVQAVTKEHPVLLNRAPTLHRLSIQAFEPKLVDGKAIRLHPLVCAAFNADFDGDQMAVHVPLSEEAKTEARVLMLASNNILSPKDGAPIVNPSQDMLLGMYYLSLEYNADNFNEVADIFEKNGDTDMANDYRYFAECDGKVFPDIDSVMKAYATNQIHAHNRVVLKMANLDKPCFREYDDNDYFLTSVGKLILNTIFPHDFQYLNEFSPDNFTKIPEKFIIKKGTNIKEYVENLPLAKCYKKGDFGPIISDVFNKFKTVETSKMLDNLKDLGFKYSCKSGVTISIFDIKVAKEKQEILEEADKAVDKTNLMYQRGLLDEKGRHEAVVRKWEETQKKLSKCVEQQFRSDKYNPLCIISESGARGSIKNFAQLCGMKGPMASTTGDTIEIPIKSSFREGLTVSEFFISTHGARKGNTDTALKTADAGYLTRRLIDVSHDIIINEEDCGCDAGTIVTDIINEKENTVISSLETRLYGRNSMRDVIHPETGEVIVHANEMISAQKAKEIVDAGIKEVEIRTLFACQSEHGVCKKCYGLNLATGNEVEIGEAVGVMAAQSIGERGTQLTLRTFHAGGVAGSDITQGLPRIQELVEARNPKGEALISEISGTIKEINENNGRSEIIISNKFDTKSYLSNFGAKVIVKVGDTIKNGQQLTDGSINPKQLLEVSDVRNTQKYILKEIKKVYKLQGDDIADKHVEVIVRQMLKKLKVIESGDSDLLPGTRIDTIEFTKVNADVLRRGGRPAVARPMILGITKASLETDSFLSSASFQETNRMLTDAVIKGKYDYLKGLKENVIVGKLIPAGTGLVAHQVDNEEIEIDDVSSLFE